MHARVDHAPRRNPSDLRHLPQQPNPLMAGFGPLSGSAALREWRSGANTRDKCGATEMIGNERFGGEERCDEEEQLAAAGAAIRQNRGLPR